MKAESGAQRAPARHRIVVRLDRGLEGYEVEEILEQEGMLTPSGRLSAPTRRRLEGWIGDGRQVTIEEVKAG
jgi:hypothetical protein